MVREFSNFVKTAKLADAAHSEVLCRMQARAARTHGFVWHRKLKSSLPSISLSSAHTYTIFGLTLRLRPGHIVTNFFHGARLTRSLTSICTTLRPGFDLHHPEEDGIFQWISILCEQLVIWTWVRTRINWLLCLLANDCASYEILVPVGRQELFDSGVLHYYDYAHLYNTSTKILARTTTQDRMLKSAEYFMAGFFGLSWTNNASLVVIIEGDNYNNSLAGYDNCNNV